MIATIIFLTFLTTFASAFGPSAPQPPTPPTPPSKPTTPSIVQQNQPAPAPTPADSEDTAMILGVVFGLVGVGIILTCITIACGVAMKFMRCYGDTCSAFRSWINCCQCLCCLCGLSDYKSI